MAKTDEQEPAPHLLVVIDHHEARVYRTEIDGAIPVRIDRARGEPVADSEGKGEVLYGSCKFL